MLSEFDEVLNKRRSIRNYTDKPISKEHLLKIIKNGTLAPTACNRQGWRFIIVDDPKIMKDIVDSGGSPIIPRAKTGILVLYHNFTNNLEYPDNTESASACIQNMLLTATHLGLGACWLNHLPTKRSLRKILNIPDSYDIIAYITLGHPAHEPKEMPRKYDSVSELISHNRFKAEKEIVNVKEQHQIRKLGKLGFAKKLMKKVYYTNPKFFNRVFPKTIDKFKVEFKN